MLGSMGSGLMPGKSGSGMERMGTLATPMRLKMSERMVRPQGLQWQAWSDDHWHRVWIGMARFEKQADVLSRPLDIVQLALVCVLGYADFRFPDCGWRKAYPALDTFHDRMLSRPSVKISVPPSA